MVNGGRQGKRRGEPAGRTYGGLDAFEKTRCQWQCCSGAEKSLGSEKNWRLLGSLHMRGNKGSTDATRKQVSEWGAKSSVENKALTDLQGECSFSHQIDQIEGRKGIAWPKQYLAARRRTEVTNPSTCFIQHRGDLKLQGVTGKGLEKKGGSKLVFFSFYKAGRAWGPLHDSEKEITDARGKRNN